MTLIDRLTQYNAWRRGETDDLQPNSTQFGKDIDEAIARIARLEAMLAAAPEGYPSWEDWLASYGVTLVYEPCPDGWQVNTEGGWLRDSSRRAKQFPDYPAALAAAKKEAGR